LVQEVVPAGQHVERALALAHVIARQAPLGVQGTLANARVAANQGTAAALEHLKSMLPRIFASQDAAEGVASFVQRREATFRGR